jgi:hypothetical protein
MNPKEIIALVTLTSLHTLLGGCGNDDCAAEERGVDTPSSCGPREDRFIDPGQYTNGSYKVSGSTRLTKRED